MPNHHQGRRGRRRPPRRKLFPPDMYFVPVVYYNNILITDNCPVVANIKLHGKYLRLVTQMTEKVLYVPLVLLHVCNSSLSWALHIKSETAWQQLVPLHFYLYGNVLLVIIYYTIIDICNCIKTVALFLRT